MNGGSAVADRRVLGYTERVLNYMEGVRSGGGGVRGESIGVHEGMAWRADWGMRLRMARGSTWLCAGADRGHIRVHVRNTVAFDILSDFNSAVDTPFEAGC